MSQDKLTKPLVTGAGGFIGYHLVQDLLNRPEVEIIYCVDLPNSPRLHKLKDNSKIRVLEINLNIDSDINLLPNDVTSVFALAALNGTSRFYSKPFTVFESSLIPTLNIIKRYATSVPIVYASSSEVYASTITNFHGSIPTNEKIIPSISEIRNPRWSYATAKLAGEVAINAASIELGAQCSIVRYHNVYGANMGYDHFIPDFVFKAQKGVYEIIGGHETRAFLHVSDAINGTILSLLAARDTAEIYHLGSSEEIKIEEAAKTILELMGTKNINITHLPSREGSVSRRLADSSKAKSQLNWKPIVNFRDGVRKYLIEEAILKERI